VALLIGANPLVSYSAGAPAGSPGWIIDRIAGGLKLLVIDPRRSDIARRAAVHLQCRPGTDAPLLACMIREILKNELQDADFCRVNVAGIEALRAAVEPFEPALVAAWAVGIPLLSQEGAAVGKQFLSQELAHAGELSDLIKSAGGKPRARPSSYNLGDPRTEAEAWSLLQNAEEITAALAAEIADRVRPAGVDILEARLTRLAYAPEIATVMLRRQQAGAVVAARQRIVDGGVALARVGVAVGRSEELGEGLGADRQLLEHDQGGDDANWQISGGILRLFGHSGNRIKPDVGKENYSGPREGASPSGRLKRMPVLDHI